MTIFLHGLIYRSLQITEDDGIKRHIQSDIIMGETSKAVYSLKAQWAKIWKKCNLVKPNCVYLYSQKAKINSFWEKIFEQKVSEKHTCGVKKEFQKMLILAFEVIVHYPSYTLYLLHYFSIFNPLC